MFAKSALPRDASLTISSIGSSQQIALAAGTRTHLDLCEPNE